MANSKDLVRPESSSLIESQVGECETFWLVKGPPFDQRDYMISPSESSCNSPTEKSAEKRRLKPGDIRVDKKYIFDSQRALRKLVDLIRDGLAHNFVNRLKELIKIFLRGNPLGFLVEDLPFIIEVIEYFSRNRDLVPEYSNFVMGIMCSAKEPPKIGKTSDLLYCKDILADYFTLFGELLATFEDDCFQIQLLGALDGLLVRRELVDISCVKITSCHEAMEESHLPLAITFLMETVPLKLYFHYLEIALKMVLISTKAAFKMIQGNILEHVLWRMEPNDPEVFPAEILEKEEELYEYYRVIDRSSYILWGLFGIISKHDLRIPIPGEKALWSLKCLFQREARKKVQRAVDARNNIAGIFVKLISIFGPGLPFGQTGWMMDVAALAVATEIKPKISWIAEVNIGVKKEDYLLKQFMLLCCCLLAKSKDLIEALKYCGVLEGLLRLINPKTTAPWISSQFTNLLIVGLRTLSEIVPQIPETYIKNKGNVRLLNRIKFLMEEEFDQDTLLEALKTFSTILSCGEKIVLEDAKMRGGISLMLNLGFRLLDVTFMKLDHQEKLARVFVSLECMLKGDDEVQTKHAEFCVSISMTFLKRILANSGNDSKWSPAFLLSFGGFLWEVIAWGKSALMSFIEHGGVFLLLDFIEVSNFPLQMLFLGALVDMTDEGETIAHLLTWRGKNGYGVVSLMIDIWRKEEYFTKVHRTKEGFIKDLDSPLMTEEQWYLTHKFPEGHFYSPSIAEMMCSARPKIHALYQFLMRRYIDETKVGESVYYLQVNAVRPAQSIYVPLLEHYLALKMGEVWYEVIRGANISGTLPLVFDGETICTLIDEKNKWASHIRTMQEEIALIDQSEDFQEEKKWYKFLKSCRLAGALEALSNLEYITRCTFKEFQKQKKEKQVSEVQNSLAKFSYINENNFHRTFFLHSNFTTLGPNSFWIKSEKEASEPEVPALVSPETIEESRFNNLKRIRRRTEETTMKKSFGWGSTINVADSSKIKNEN